jgi:hypothetical protein
MFTRCSSDVESDVKDRGYRARRMERLCDGQGPMLSEREGGQPV